MDGGCEKVIPIRLVSWLRPSTARQRDISLPRSRQDKADNNERALTPPVSSAAFKWQLNAKRFFW